MRLRAWACLHVIGLAVVHGPATPAQAGGAYAVDDAAIGNPGDCQVENWVSPASDGDFIGVSQPACVVQVGIPVEFTAIFQGLRAKSEWTGIAGLQGKAILIPMGPGNTAVALTVGTTVDRAGESALSFVNVPVTLKVRDQFRINLNVGWTYDGIVDDPHVTWGAGFEWDLAKSMVLIAEVFGQTGHLGDPRFQAGLRYMPVDTVDLDLIYGNNITGESDVLAEGEAANWLTAGVTVRF